MDELRRIVEGATRLTLLGGGEARREDLEEALALAPALVCVDGGVNRALEWGFRPRAVVGDADSMDPSAVAAAGVPHIPAPDQTFTDFDKALQGLGHALVLGVGFLGGRLDHQLAALTSLSRAPGPAVLVGRHEVAAVVPRRITLDLDAGTTVSLWPLAPSRARSRGLRWALDGLTLDPRGRVGTSNEATGGPMEVTVEEGELILMLPREMLAPLCEALGG